MNASEATESLLPGELNPTALYELLTSIVHPRPIALVSSVSASGIRNLAPFSFFMLGGTNPPSIVFSPVLGSRGEKDSLRNIRETGEFVVNTVHRDMIDPMNQAGRSVPFETDEWELSGLTPLRCDLVTPERVAESFASLECRLHQVVDHGEGGGAARYVIGEVVRIHLSKPAESLKSDPVRLIGRLGGAEYVDETDVFEVSRPLS